MKIRALTLILCMMILAWAVGCGDDEGSSTLKACLKGCTTVSDCCTTPPCDKGANAQKCSSGVCEFVGCSSDADCKTAKCGAVIVKVFDLTKTYKMCGNFCTQDSDCASMSKDAKCFDGVSMGVITAKDKACAIPCTKDDDCSKQLLNKKCIGGKYCGIELTPEPNCTTDADCASDKKGHTTCDPTNKVCICSSDAVCQSTLGAAGGTYKCATP